VNPSPRDLPSVRVLFSCTGIGLENRGIESFFREAFAGLKDTPGLEAKLLRSHTGCKREPAGVGELPISCFPRTGKVAQVIGKVAGRSAYAVEQWSSFSGSIREIRRFRPHVIFTSEANLCFLFRRFRPQIGVPFRVLFSNGGPCQPPFDRYDFVHQVAPYYRSVAIDAGEPPGKHLLVPYGIRVPNKPPIDPEAKRQIRSMLGLPLDRPVILSAGWIARKHKRMHHLIEEVARLPQPRPFVQMLGTIDGHSPEILALAAEKLGTGNFAAASVRYADVADYYRSADVFVLCSLAEGFGRVYLEALMHGLPTFGHRHPVIEYVLGDAGTVVDMETPGALCAALASLDLEHCNLTADNARARWESVRQRFGWETLAPDYLEMFRISGSNAKNKLNA
jgi:1,2-diacylglycerol 3-alpha-glucosyltransferase